jgi:hypothetical protein
MELRQLKIYEENTWSTYMKSDMYHIHVYIFISTKLCCGTFPQGTKATESCCYTMTSTHAIMSLSKGLSLGNDYEVSGNTTATATQQIHNMTTITYDNKESPIRDHLNNCIQQQDMLSL